MLSKSKGGKSPSVRSGLQGKQAPLPIPPPLPEILPPAPIQQQQQQQRGLPNRMNSAVIRTGDARKDMERDILTRFRSHAVLAPPPPPPLPSPTPPQSQSSPKIGASSASNNSSQRSIIRGGGNNNNNNNDSSRLQLPFETSSLRSSGGLQQLSAPVRRVIDDEQQATATVTKYPNGSKHTDKTNSSGDVSSSNNNNDDERKGTKKNDPAETGCSCIIL